MCRRSFCRDRCSLVAIVGGHDAPAGQFTSVAEMTFASFGCSGTLIAPNYVLTAGHCGSITGAAIASTAAWPAAALNVRIGSNKAGQGESRAVKKVTINPNYTRSTRATTSRC